MDPSLQALLGQLERVSDQFSQLRDGIQKAIRIADADPEMALTRARKVLEYVIRDVYVRRLQVPAGTQPLENLLQLLRKHGYFPERLDAYASVVRKLGNVGTHNFDEQVGAVDVYQSLTQLMPILEWYFEVERPEALAGQAMVRPASRPAKAPFTQRALVPAPPKAVVPKGLRSFDANDADFFLDLLPGPRDKDGLPESIRFWKHRIETRDDATFTVGVIYGPSGCGKSSLVKAGLLPRLSDDVISIFVEATAGETEARLLNALLKRCPDQPRDASLVQVLTALRYGRGLPEGKKVLIVLDQFEQWLHAHRDEQTSALAQALRQCDGDHVQCLLLIRDDFWVALSRFVTDLYVDLLQGQNMTLVDLFDPIHARQVLTAFGRALGRLDQNTTKDQEAFLDQAVDGLTQDGRIIPIRLALFAEMVKGKPWLPATLQGVGPEGIGVLFLEQTLGSRSVDSKHRVHETAARGVLQALLPEVGTEIKGHMRSRNELLQASGYQDPDDFSALLRILDSELRLIAPTTRESIHGKSTSTPEQYFQLTHDYLVSSVREWLTRKQRETRRGRAELRLAERAALWNDAPESRQLPSLLEFLNIRLLTRRANWTRPEQDMMRKAGRYYGVRGLLAASFMAIAFFGWRQVYGWMEARSLVDQLVTADTAQVPRIVERIDAHRGWANPLLKQEAAQAKDGSTQQLHLKLALLPVDDKEADDLVARLLVLPPNQFTVVRDALLPHQQAIIEPLWGVALWHGEPPRDIRFLEPEMPSGGPRSANLADLRSLVESALAESHQYDAYAVPFGLDSRYSFDQRFQAACALATYAPDDERWQFDNNSVANRLVSLQASEFLAWREALRPAKKQLIAPLCAIYRDQKQSEQSRNFAAESLADYAFDDPDLLFDLLADAEPFQFPIIYGKLERHKERIPTLAREEFHKSCQTSASENEKEGLARRQANAAIALYRNGMYDEVWPWLKFTPDPRVRSYVIHWLKLLGADPQPLMVRLGQEPDVTVRRALVLTLGEFGNAGPLTSDQEQMIKNVLVMFEHESDPGLHAAVAWLLQQWGQGDRLQWAVNQLRANEERLETRRGADDRRWYVNTQGQTFVVLDADEFVMGSPDLESAHRLDESQHRRHLGRRYEIGMTNVTKGQYERFLKDHPEMRKDVSHWIQTEDSPQTFMTWYEAACYCNWLSRQEGIAEKEWCFEPNDAGEYGPGMKAKDNYLDLHGYRLPTEAEWEYACRAGTMTSRYYGTTPALLPKYARFEANGENRAWPVASLKPNDFGLFDMHGNAWQWCFDQKVRYPEHAVGPMDDSPTTKPVRENSSVVLRGGAFDDPQVQVRSAYRNSLLPGDRSIDLGFRPARTCP